MFAWKMADFAIKPLKTQDYSDKYREECQVCFNCPYPDCKKGYCDRIKDFRRQWHIKNKN